MQTDKDYRIKIVSELIEELKDKNYRIKSKDLAVEIVKLFDNISGQEYRSKINGLINDAKSFSRKV